MAPLSFQEYYLDKIYIQMQFTFLNNWKSIYVSLWNIVSRGVESQCVSADQDSAKATKASVLSLVGTHSKGTLQVRPVREVWAIENIQNIYIL